VFVVLRTQFVVLMLACGSCSLFELTEEQKHIRLPDICDTFVVAPSLSNSISA